MQYQKGNRRKSVKYIDVSFPYRKDMAIYPANPEFIIERVQDIGKGDRANISLISMGSHTGTHIAVPSHFVKGGKTIDQLTLDEMNGVAKLFDLRGYGEITKELLEKHDINQGDIIMLKTDNSKMFHCDTVLNDYVTLDYKAAEYLVKKNIKMVCIDYMTIERPKQKRIQGISIHNILLSQEILIAETLKLDRVEEGEYQLFCFPLNVVGADGVPVRIVLGKVENNGYIF